MNVTSIYLMVIGALICYSAVKGGSYLFEAKLPVKDKSFNLDQIAKRREKLSPRAKLVIRKAYAANKISRWGRWYLSRQQ